MDLFNGHLYCTRVHRMDCDQFTHVLLNNLVSNLTKRIKEISKREKRKERGASTPEVQICLDG